jgi:protoheme IX farnesyltransferase
MMKIAATAEPEIAPAVPDVPPVVLDVPAVTGVTAAAPTRLADYLDLTKPRIAVMALFTVAIGYLLGAGAAADGWVLLNTVLGAGLVAAGGSALNQWWERKSDARMRRTRNRPLPARRLTPAEAVAFGVVLGVLGLAYLTATVPHPAAAVVAAVTLVSYVAIYTPLKTTTEWNTLVGAVPGALPPVIGWCTARGWADPLGAAGPFLIIFLWQLPHFLAIAWMYREDYARGGLRMLPGSDPTGRKTAAAMIATCAGLIAVSLVPVIAGPAGAVYAAGAVLTGLLFLRQTVRFERSRTDKQARKVLRASLLYLPAVLGLLLLDRLLPVW